jgi:hypothetical protein
MGGEGQRGGPDGGRGVVCLKNKQRSPAVVRGSVRHRVGPEPHLGPKLRVVLGMSGCSGDVPSSKTMLRVEFGVNMARSVITM